MKHKGIILLFDNLKKRLKAALKTALKENKTGQDHVIEQVVDSEIDKFVMGE